jgi:hypothetical protein
MKMGRVLKKIPKKSALEGILWAYWNILGNF